MFGIAVGVGVGGAGGLGLGVRGGLLGVTIGRGDLDGATITLINADGGDRDLASSRS
jgi:hypothetical protein